MTIWICDQLGQDFDGDPEFQAGFKQRGLLSGRGPRRSADQ